MKKIDVLIPAVEKDLDVLPYAVDSVNKQVRHPIGMIYIVAPESKKIRSLCQNKGCQFVNEDALMPIAKKDISYAPVKNNVSVDRSGWLFQQLLKLSGDSLGISEGFLVLDADTVLIRPHIFEHQGKSVLFRRTLYYKPYFTTYKRLLGEEAPGPAKSVFFVSHYMFFKKNRLGELKKLIELRHGVDWYRAILTNINRKQWDSFSEYETYGNFMMRYHPNEVILKPRRNLSLKRANLGSISKINLQQLAAKGNFRSISFHSWNK